MNSNSIEEQRISRQKWIEDVLRDFVGDDAEKEEDATLRLLAFKNIGNPSDTDISVACRTIRSFALEAQGKCLEFVCGWNGDQAESAQLVDQLLHHEQHSIQLQALSCLLALPRNHYQSRIARVATLIGTSESATNLAVIILGKAGKISTQFIPLIEAAYFPAEDEDLRRRCCWAIGQIDRTRTACILSYVKSLPEELDDDARDYLSELLQLYGIDLNPSRK